jgi:hypothetical protein
MADVIGRCASCRVREHFAATQREADRLLLQSLPQLQEQLARLLDTDGFKERMKADGAAATMSRWHELRVLVISRLLTSQCALALARRRAPPRPPRARRRTVHGRKKGGGRC